MEHRFRRDAGRAFDRARGIVERANQYYLPTLRHSFHVKFRIANAVSSLLPDFFSGIIRGKLYQLAGFDIGQGAYIMGNIEVITNQPGLYDKLAIGPGTVV